MDQNTSSATPATDDQELAKVLAGMNEQTQALEGTEAPAADATTTTEPAATDAAADATAVTPDAAATEPAIPDPMQFEPATLPTPAVASPTLAPVSPDLTGAAAAPAVPQLTPELESLKKDALEELRPLVDKLDLPAQEKFDTLLLIIRSTDDQSLLTAAHTAAKAIEDETKRAQALLDVIKEIDFFSTQKTA